MFNHGHSWFCFNLPGQVRAIPYYGMVKSLPIMLGKVTSKPIKQARQCTQHNGQGWGHDMTWHYGPGWQIQQFEILKKIVQHTFWSLLWKYMIISRRLHHIMSSRKWHNLPLQTFNVQQVLLLYNMSALFFNFMEHWTIAGLILGIMGRRWGGAIMACAIIDMRGVSVVYITHESIHPSIHLSTMMILHIRWNCTICTWFFPQSFHMDSTPNLYIHTHICLVPMTTNY
jgi:hypothetical protein